MSKIRFNAGKYEIDTANLISYLKIIALVLINIIGRFISVIVAFWVYLRYASNGGELHNLKNDRLLFLAPAGIGDIAILIPILQEYRHHFHDSRLLMVTKPHYAELVAKLGLNIIVTFEPSNLDTRFHDWISILTYLWFFAPTTCIVPGTWRCNNNLLNIFARISGAPYLVGLHRIQPQYPTQIFCNRFFDNLYTISQTTHEREADIFLLQKITAKHLFISANGSLCLKPAQNSLIFLHENTRKLCFADINPDYPGSFVQSSIFDLTFYFLLNSVIFFIASSLCIYVFWFAT